MSRKYTRFPTKAAAGPPPLVDSDGELEPDDEEKAAVQAAVQKLQQKHPKTRGEPGAGARNIGPPPLTHSFYSADKNPNRQEVAKRVFQMLGEKKTWFVTKGLADERPAIGDPCLKVLRGLSADFAGHTFELSGSQLMHKCGSAGGAQREQTSNLVFVHSL